MSTQTVHLTIHGRVQGVGYRAWTVATARRCGLRGWVRNRREGTVEAVFHGEYEMVELMKAHCRHGPEAARVKFIEEREWRDEIGEDFRSLGTV